MTSGHQNKLLFLTKVKIFLRFFPWKKVLTFFFFLLVAFGFWLLQYLQQQFEIDLSIPLQYENRSAEVVSNDPLPTEIKLRVLDKGTVLLNYSFTKKLNPIKINLIDTLSSRSSVTISSEFLEKEITGRLSASTRLLSYFPHSFTIDYLPVMKKEVPVRINGSITFASGYMFADSLHIAPERIVVYGNKNILDTLTAVSTEPVTIKKLDKPFKKTARLLLPTTLVSNQKQVVLSGNVERFTEKKVTVPIHCTNLPENYIVHFFPSKANILCRTTLSNYGSLQPDDFVLQVDYNQLVLSKKSLFPLTLSMKPDRLMHFTISPEQVEFLIEKKTKP
jgi:hypothetical protein